MVDILDKVKTGLGITGDFQDEMLTLYIEEVKEFMLDAGVKKEVIESTTSVGVITRGVADLWNFGAGNTDFSPYFIKRVIQKAYDGTSSSGSGGSGGSESHDCHCVEPISKDTIGKVFDVLPDSNENDEPIEPFTREEIMKIMGEG